MHTKALASIHISNAQITLNLLSNPSGYRVILDRPSIAPAPSFSPSVSISPLPFPFLPYLSLELDPGGQGGLQSGPQSRQDKAKQHSILNMGNGSCRKMMHQHQDLSLLSVFPVGMKLCFCLSVTLFPLEIRSRCEL